MHGHPQPIGGLFLAHLLDAPEDGADVRPASHGSERAEHQPEAESVILGKTSRERFAWLHAADVHAMYRELPKDAVLDEVEIASAEPGEALRCREVGTRGGRNLPDLNLEVACAMRGGANLEYGNGATRQCADLRRALHGLPPAMAVSEAAAAVDADASTKAAPVANLVSRSASFSG